MKPFCQYALVLFLAGGITGCRSASSQRAQKLTEPSTASVETANMESEAEQDYLAQVEALSRYATGVSYEINEQPELAIEEFYKSALADSSDQAFILDTSRRLLQNKENDKAIQLLQLASKRPEASGFVFGLLGRAYFSAGQTNQAISANEKAIKVSPTSLIGYQNLAEIHFLSGNTNEGVRVLDEASKLQNADAAFLVNLAEIYSKQIQLQPKQFDTLKPRAVQLLERAAALKPQNTGLQQKMADGFALVGERSKAGEIYEQLLEKYVEFPVLRDPIREKLANNYLLAGDKKKATEQLELIVKENPARYPQTYYLLARLADEAKDFKRAAEHYSRTILLLPEFEQAYYDLAAAQLNLDRASEVLLTLERATNRFKPNFISEFYAALASQRLEQFPVAIKHLVTAEEIARAGDAKRLDHTFYYQLGSCYERNRDFEAAEKAFRKALELKSDDADILNYLGYMWAEQGTKLSEALDVIAKALKMDPDNSAFLDSMGWALFRSNKSGEALPYLTRAAELAKQPDATIYDHLGDVYFSLKQLERAREAWEKSIAIEPNEEVKKKLGSFL